MSLLASGSFLEWEIKIPTSFYVSVSLLLMRWRPGLILGEHLFSKFDQPIASVGFPS